MAIADRRERDRAARRRLIRTTARKLAAAEGCAATLGRRENPLSRVGWRHRLGLIPPRIWVQLDMYARQLHTRQYTDAELLRLLRAERTKVTGKHTIRAITTMVTLGLAAWCGSGIAHADNNHEQEACALMNDYGTAIGLGMVSTVQYAFAVLSTEMPPADAAHVLGAATRDDCPNHAAELPEGWL